MKSLSGRAFIGLGVLLVCGFISTPVQAGQGHGAARPNAPVIPDHAGGPMQVEGRVLAVRRLSREVTVRTPQGAVHQVYIPPRATIAAHGAAGLNAVRSGGNVRLSVTSKPAGKLTARSVAVH